MKKIILQEKSLKFSYRIINLYKYLCNSRKEYIISKQILRSGLSVGANISESIYAESKADFIHKLAIAQKEINETIYWLESLKNGDFINRNEFISLNNDAVEILKILTTSIKTAKRNHLQN